MEGSECENRRQGGGRDRRRRHAPAAEKVVCTGVARHSVGIRECHAVAQVSRKASIYARLVCPRAPGYASWTGMTKHNDERFRPQPKPPRARGGGRSPRLIARVLKEIAQGGGSLSIGSSNRRRPTLARLGRGHVAASFAGASLGPRSRRVVIKARLVRLKALSPGTLATHMRYLARDGITRKGEPGHAYNTQQDQVDLPSFAATGSGDRHQFRFIVAPEDGVQLEDLRDFTRTLMAQVERDLGTRLEWVAVDHWDTDNPHTHVVLRGKDDRGKDLIIARSYITHGMRHRACELATEWLGERTESEIRAAIGRDVDREGWTDLDRDLTARSRDGVIDLRDKPDNVSVPAAADVVARPPAALARPWGSRVNSSPAVGNSPATPNGSCELWKSATTSCGPCSGHSPPSAATL